MDGQSEQRFLVEQDAHHEVPIVCCHRGTRSPHGGGKSSFWTFSGHRVIAMLRPTGEPTATARASIWPCVSTSIGHTSTGVSSTSLQPQGRTSTHRSWRTERQACVVRCGGSTTGLILCFLALGVKQYRTSWRMCKMARRRGPGRRVSG